MKKRIIIAVVSLMLVSTLLLCIVPSIAKYITGKGKQSEITSENFYFSSNFLKSDEEPVYEIYGNSVTFEVRNYIDSLRINATDIDYTVNTDPADGGSLDKTGGTLEKSITPASQEVKLTYNFSEYEDRKEITVTVTGEGKDTTYTKELKAKFIFIKQDSSFRYEIKDVKDRDYAELYIYMGNRAKDVTINWDKAKLLIDETNDYVFGKLNEDKKTVTINNIIADTTVKIVFFKIDIKANYDTLGLKKSDGTIDMPTTSTS